MIVPFGDGPAKQGDAGKSGVSLQTLLFQTAVVAAGALVGHKKGGQIGFVGGALAGWGAVMWMDGSLNILECANLFGGMTQQQVDECYAKKSRRQLAWGLTTVGGLGIAVYGATHTQGQGTAGRRR